MYCIKQWLQLVMEYLLQSMHDEIFVAVYDEIFVAVHDEYLLQHMVCLNIQSYRYQAMVAVVVEYLLYVLLKLRVWIFYLLWLQPIKEIISVLQDVRIDD